MSVQLLDKTRKINKLLHNNHSHRVEFNDICEVLSGILESNILVISQKGKILGAASYSGIESIPKGQYEAAEVLGYSKVQTFWKIIFPQMVKRVLPPVTNEVITLVKDTSLAFALAYTEMFTLAKQVAASTASIMPLFIAGLFYYIFNFLVAMVMEKLEKRMQYFD